MTLKVFLTWKKGSEAVVPVGRRLAGQVSASPGMETPEQVAFSHSYRSRLPSVGEVIFSEFWND